MSNKFLELYKTNKSLSTNDKKELVSFFSEDLCFDEVFDKQTILPSDIESILENYGSFWVTIDSDPGNSRQPHAVVVSDITKDKAENALIKYYDVFDGSIKETNFTDFVLRVKQGTEDLKTAVVRLIEKKGEGKKKKKSDKIALFLSTTFENGAYITKYEFDDHWDCLRENGFTNIRIVNGQDLINNLSKLESNSINRLLILSHSITDGLVAAKIEDGLYIDDYMTRQKNTWKESFIERQKLLKLQEFANTFKFISNDTDTPLFETLYDAYFKVYLESERFKSDLEEFFKFNKDDIGYAEMSDILKVKNIFKKNAKIILAGCNTAGYAGGSIGESKTIASELSKTSGVEVIGSIGYAAPVQNSCERRSSYKWFSNLPDGTVKKISDSSIIDFSTI